jgi:hypothetical protein
MIPEFQPTGILPPFVGSGPALRAGRAPYLATISELVSRFGTSPERRRVLGGLLDYRRRLQRLGIVDGFQWIDGSFVENCELRNGRPPGDVDIVTFLRRPEGARDDDSWAEFVTRNDAELMELFDASLAKSRFLCDAYVVELDMPSEAIVANTHYWFGLFSHSRLGGEWKGLVQVGLFDPADDDAALVELSVRALHG